MTITVFPDVVLPASAMQAGVQGRNNRNNTRSVNQGGFVQVNVNWQRTLREYDFGFTPMLPKVWQLIEGLHEVTEGGAYGFLMQDPKDSSVLITEGIMTGTAATVGPFKLVKRIASIGSARFKDRPITRPVLAGLVVLVNGIAPLSIYTVDATTGTVNFAVALLVGDVLSWSGSFYVPVHFQNDTLQWDLVRSGPAENRVVMGQSVVLQEVRE